MNNDLISRSELMKAIGTMVEAEMPIDEKWALGLKYSLKVIDNAPTVDIPNFGGKVVAQINFDGEKMDEIVEQLRNEILNGALVLKDQRWIPISYRELTDEEREELDPAIRFKWTCPLPEDMEEVLITTKYGNVQLATFEVTEEGSFFDEMDEDDVIAWMPLPSPYKPEEES